MFFKWLGLVMEKELEMIQCERQSRLFVSHSHGFTRYVCLYLIGRVFQLSLPALCFYHLKNEKKKPPSDFKAKILASQDHLHNHFDFLYYFSQFFLCLFRSHKTHNNNRPMSPSSNELSDEERAQKLNNLNTHTLAVQSLPVVM